MNYNKDKDSYKEQVSQRKVADKGGGGGGLPQHQSPLRGCIVASCTALYCILVLPLHFTAFWPYLDLTMHLTVNMVDAMKMCWQWTGDATALHIFALRYLDTQSLCCFFIPNFSLNLERIKREIWISIFSLESNSSRRRRLVLLLCFWFSPRLLTIDYIISLSPTLFVFLHFFVFRIFC